MYSNHIVSDILKANPSRSHDNISRRLIKILEELGETSEAYLSKSSVSNYKNKTWEDYREEGIDTLIVMVDVALTSLPLGNFPPASMLPLHISDGKRNAPTDFSGMERMKFEVARAVCSAEHFLHEPNGDAGFYGAVARGVKAAASLCYARIPDQPHENIDNRVYDKLQEKLAKWVGKSTVETDLPSKNLLTIEKIEDIDQVEYYEKMRDRHQ